MNRQPKTLKHPLLRPILCGRGQIAVATRSNWRHVGMIGKLNMYPLLAGSKVSYSTCNFTQTEMTGTSAHEECRNHMMIVYNCRTNYVIYNNVWIPDITVKYMGDFVVQMSRSFEPDLIINLKELAATGTKIICTTSYCRKAMVKLKCIDCGSEAAAWISSSIDNVDARLAYVVAKLSGAEKYWDDVQTSLTPHQNEPTTQKLPKALPLTDSPRIYFLMPISLHDYQPSQLLLAIEKKGIALNIYVRTDEFFEVIQWDLIMMGDAVFKNVLKDRFNKSAQESKSKFMGMVPIQCEVMIPGQVQVGDNVYVIKETE